MSFCFISGKQFSLATPANDKWLRDDLHEQWMMTYETFTFFSINFWKYVNKISCRKALQVAFTSLYVTNGSLQQ